MSTGRVVVGVDGSPASLQALWVAAAEAQRRDAALYVVNSPAIYGQSAPAVAAGLDFAADVMTTPAITVGPDATVVEAAKLMIEREVKRLPVVDSDGCLVGIVSRADLLWVFLRPDEEIAEEIRYAPSTGLSMLSTASPIRWTTAKGGICGRWPERGSVARTYVPPTGARRL